LHFLLLLSLLYIIAAALSYASAIHVAMYTLNNFFSTIWALVHIAAYPSQHNTQIRTNYWTQSDNLLCAQCLRAFNATCRSSETACSSEMSSVTVTELATPWLATSHLRTYSPIRNSSRSFAVTPQRVTSMCSVADLLALFCNSFLTSLSTFVI